MAFVYAYFRLNGEPCYIGKGKADRWAVHLTRKTNPHLWNIIQQAKALGRELPVVILRDNITDAEALEIECALIAAIGRADLGTGPLVNLTDGGDGHAGYRQSDELKERRRKWWTPERRAAFAAVSLERHVNPETRAKYERNQRAGMVRPEVRDKCATGRRGKANSKEHRETLRQASADYWANPANREAQRQRVLARYRDPAERDRTGEAVRKGQLAAKAKETT